ncbi:MAG: thiamine phosphate synthase [Gammaproteobacteria bacterium]
MASALPPCGLYAITESRLTPPGTTIEQVSLAIDGGAVVIQYREKHLPRKERGREARALATLCCERDIPLIINDDIELAAACGAAGVHLGQDDAPVSRARRRLGQRAIIGVSCYNQMERARTAAGTDASYVAFGRFFPSNTKPGAVQALPALLSQARREIKLPIVAIGGITPENGAELVHAGANLLAVIHGLFGQSDIRAAAQAYTALFDAGHGPDP